MKNQIDEYELGLKKFRWFQWQVIRRHEDYINFCDKQTFNKMGMLENNNAPTFSELIVNPTLAPDLETPEEVTEIKKRFCLNMIYHYSKDLSPEQCIDVCAGYSDLVRIWPDDETFDSKKLPQYGEFIYFGINIANDVKWRDINAQIREYVDLARETRKQSRRNFQEDIEKRIRKAKSFLIKPNIAIDHLHKELLHVTQDHHGKEIKRFYFDKDIFKVWDLHKEGKAPIEIIQQMWPKEYEKECMGDIYEQNKRWEELVREYQDQGLESEEAGDKAYYEAYGSSSGCIKLYMRVRDKLNRMERLFQRMRND